MAYADVDTAFRAARTNGDVRGKIETAFQRRAWTRLTAVANNEDQREANLCRAIASGAYPDSYVLIVLDRLDVAGKLATQTDAEVDTAVTQAWTRLIAVS